MTSQPVEFSKEAALQLCTEIRQEYNGRWWTLAGMQCMGCNAATKGEDSKRCLNGAPGYRGCNLVNARIDRMIQEQ